VGLTSILVAKLVSAGVHPAAAIAVALAVGTALGGAMGAIIRHAGLPPFLVTLAGMFFIRGVAFLISLESVTIKHPLYDALADLRIGPLPLTAVLLAVALPIGLFVAHHTRFGRNVYAIGGNEASSLLMGVPVGRTKNTLYALSGFTSALAGVLYGIYTSAGNATAGTMLELDAIAAVVIGGTLLSGGVGSLVGTLVGVLILGVIQTILTFEGTLSSWWARIAVGLLLLGFILLQRLLERRARGSRALVA
jgi:galactofuranose transport system permease protein